MIVKNKVNKCMTGITEDMPSEIGKIAELVEISRFIPLSFIKDNVRTGDCRIEYLINDAVESFIILKNATMTGGYMLTNYQQSAAIQAVDGGYMLVISQSSVNKFTIKFEDICVEEHYFNYGDIGHFWITKYEYIRQLEYQLTTLRDKRRFLGDESCNELEKKLSLVADFPVIKLYRSVRKEYYVPYPDSIEQEAVDYLLSLCEKADDKSLYKAIQKYVKKQSDYNLIKLATMFHRKKHFKVIKLLIEELRIATKEYDNRIAQEDKDSDCLEVDEKVKKIVSDLEKANKEFIVYREEPFVFVKDSLKYRKHIMIFDKGIINNKCRVIRV